MTVGELPNHSHQIILGDGNLVHGGNGTNANITLGGKQWAYDNKPYTKEVGGNQYHNNIPPSTVAYEWYRIS